MVRTTADEDCDRKLLDDIRDYGWHVVGISDDDQNVSYVFSIGLFHTFKHPEVCVFGLNDIRTMGQIINTIVNLIQSGQKFEDRSRTDAVLEGYDCVFRSISPEFFGKYFGYARWFYEGDQFSMLQSVWPDPSGHFPWDPGYAYTPDIQPVLGIEDPWPFDDAKDLGVFTTRGVLENDQAILRVVHDVDGDWQFLCETTADTEDARVVSLEYVFENHPSIRELADLPMGWNAKRASPAGNWIRSKID